MQLSSLDAVLGQDSLSTTPSQGAQTMERSSVGLLAGARAAPQLDGRTDETIEVRMEEVSPIPKCGETDGIELPDVAHADEEQPSTTTVDPQNATNGHAADVEEANGSLRSTIETEEVVTSEEDSTIVEQDPTMDNEDNNEGDEETQGQTDTSIETGPSTAEKKRIIRREVLAEIFPARKDGESLRFDNEASTYYVVETPVLPENGTEKEVNTPPSKDDMLTDLKVTKSLTKEGQTEPSNSLALSNDSVVVDDDDDERAGIMCNICLEPILESKVSGMCPHVYHCDCLLEWTKRENHDYCPTCRRPLWDSKVYKSLEMDVLDRLGFDPNFDQQQVVEEMVYEEPGRAWKYLWRAAHVICCLLIILFFAQALMPTAPLAGKYWW